MSGRFQVGALGGIMMLLPISSVATPSKPPKKIEQGYAPGAEGVRLFYRKMGAGPDVVVFLHGGPGASMHDGGREMEPIAKSHTLIMYDQRGGGRSDIITDPSRLTAADHVRDLESLRRHFGIEKFSLIGLSWGSGLAALYASEYPERVSRIVFLAPLPPARSPYLQQRVDKTNSLLSPQEIVRYREIMKLYPASTDKEAVSLCREQFRIIEKPYRLKPRSAELQLPDICNVPPAAIRNFWVVNAAVFTSLGDYDFRPKLSKLKMPVLVIEGARSPVPLDATEEWARSAPHARLLLIPDAGHGVYDEQPEALLNAIRVFLRGDWPATAAEINQPNATGGKWKSIRERSMQETLRLCCSMLAAKVAQETKLLQPEALTHLGSVCRKALPFPDWKSRPGIDCLVADEKFARPGSHANASPYQGRLDLRSFGRFDNFHRSTFRKILFPNRKKGAQSCKP